jgi:hypothetical protein
MRYAICEFSNQLRKFKRRFWYETIQIYLGWS